MNNKGVSRKRNRLCMILLWAVIILLLIGYFIKSPAMMYCSIGILILASVLMLTTNRCPNCGEHFRGIFWSKEAGFCSKCGKKIYFDDEVKE